MAESDAKSLLKYLSEKTDASQDAAGLRADQRRSVNDVYVRLKHAGKEFVVSGIMPTERGSVRLCGFTDGGAAMVVMDRPHGRECRG